MVSPDPQIQQGPPAFSGTGFTGDLAVGGMAVCLFNVSGRKT